MKNLKAKLRKNGGFTLIEMLIVVAIIAILIAISIPLVGSALEKAREATDAANERAFKSALVSSYLLTEAKMNADGDTAVKATDATGATNIYVYDAVNGKVKENDTGINAYGKSNGLTTSKLYGVVTASGEVHMTWNDSKPTAIADNGTNLKSPGLVAPAAGG